MRDHRSLQRQCPSITMIRNPFNVNGLQDGLSRRHVTQENRTFDPLPVSLHNARKRNVEGLKAK
jgi:hypothetical protein